MVRVESSRRSANCRYFPWKDRGYCVFQVGIWRVQKRYPQYGIPIWRLWSNIRFLPSTVTEKNATKNILDEWKDGRTEVKQYTPSLFRQRGYNKLPFKWYIKYKLCYLKKCLYTHTEILFVHFYKFFFIITCTFSVFVENCIFILPKGINEFVVFLYF